MWKPVISKIYSPAAFSLCVDEKPPSRSAHALGEGADDFNLLVAGKDIHGGPNPSLWGNGPRPGKSTDFALYCAKRSFSLGPNPWVDDPGRNPPPPPPPPPQGKVKIMESERVVFTEESNPQNYLKLIASGDVDETMLEALEDDVGSSGGLCEAPKKASCRPLSGRRGTNGRER